jgi:hypothetical protein
MRRYKSTLFEADEHGGGREIQYLPVCLNKFDTIRTGYRSMTIRKETPAAVSSSHAAP